MELAYYLIALILAIILFVVGATRKSSGTRKKLFWIAGIIAVVGVIVLFASPTTVFSYDATTGVKFFAVGGGVVYVPQTVGGVTPETVDVKGCSVTDSQTITLSATDKYNNGAVGGSHRYSINGAPASTVSDAGTLTAYVGNKIKVLWMNESTSSYFSKPAEYTVVCEGTRTFSEKLVNNGTLTASLKNDLGNAMSSSTSTAGAVNETLGVGDIKDVEITLTGQFQKEFPYGFVGVVDYNKTVIDDVTLNQNGVAFSTAVIPQSDSIAYAGESSTKGYEIPAVISNANTVFKATIDVDDTRNPTGSTGDDIIIRLYPKNYYVNNKNGGSYDGPSAQDEDNVLTRGQATAVYIHVQ